MVCSWLLIWFGSCLVLLFCFRDAGCVCGLLWYYFALDWLAWFVFVLVVAVVLALGLG